MTDPAFARLADTVKDFYRAMPFNFAGGVEQAADLLRRMNAIRAYPNLDQLLRGLPAASPILDIGCGTGWFVNTVALHYQLPCTGLDQCQEAVERARATCERLAIADLANFAVGDLFAIHHGERFALVNSIGVLHHTPDCHKALASIAPLVRQKGYIHIALYHRYGREPFLDYFAEERKAWFAGGIEDKSRAEAQALAKYGELNPHITDATFLRSWCRDQVFHPHETLHTLEETCDWLRRLDFTPLSTSINNFKPVDRWTDLFALEKEKEHISYRSNYIDKRYFPGFFTVLAGKN